MDIENFRNTFKETLNLIIKYQQDLPEYPVIPSVLPGFLSKKLDKFMPQKAESFQSIIDDIKNIILKGSVHWNHPQFYGYFSIVPGYAAILAEMLVAAFPSLCTTFASSPAIAEMELHTLDVFGRLIELPEYFLFKDSKGAGGGIMHNSSSDAIYSIMLAVRNEQRRQHGNYFNLKKFIIYHTAETHSRVLKAAHLLMLSSYEISSDKMGAMNLMDLKKTMARHFLTGKVPIMIVANMGASGTGAIDPILAISYFRKANVHIHVDAAYGGPALMLQENMYLGSKGWDIDSININPHKMLTCGADSAILYVRNRHLLRETFHCFYKEYKFIPKYNNYDPCDYSICQTRGFRAFRLYVVMRLYGRKLLANYIRHQFRLAKFIEKGIRRLGIYEIVNVVRFGIVCCRLKMESSLKEDYMNMAVIDGINASQQAYISPIKINNKIAIRICICSEFTTTNTLMNLLTLLKIVGEKVMKGQFSLDSTKNSPFSFVTSTIVQDDKKFPNKSKCSKLLQENSMEIPIWLKSYANTNKEIFDILKINYF